jgi:hypothetical protein
MTMVVATERYAATDVATLVFRVADAHDPTKVTSVVRRIPRIGDIVPVCLPTTSDNGVVLVHAPTDRCTLEALLSDPTRWMNFADTRDEIATITPVRLYHVVLALPCLLRTCIVYQIEVFLGTNPFKDMKCYERRSTSFANICAHVKLERTVEAEMRIIQEVRKGQVRDKRGSWVMPTIYGNIVLLSDDNDHIFTTIVCKGMPSTDNMEIFLNKMDAKTENVDLTFKSYIVVGNSKLGVRLDQRSDFSLVGEHLYRITGGGVRMSLTKSNDYVLFTISNWSGIWKMAFPDAEGVLMPLGNTKTTNVCVYWTGAVQFKILFSHPLPDFTPALHQRLLVLCDIFTNVLQDLM